MLKAPILENMKAEFARVKTTMQEYQELLNKFIAAKDNGYIASNTKEDLNQKISIMQDTLQQPERCYEFLNNAMGALTEALESTTQRTETWALFIHSNIKSFVYGDQIEQLGFVLDRYNRIKKEADFAATEILFHTEFMLLCEDVKQVVNKDDFELLQRHPAHRYLDHRLDQANIRWLERLIGHFFLLMCDLEKFNTILEALKFTTGIDYFDALKMPLGPTPLRMNTGYIKLCDSYAALQNTRENLRDNYVYINATFAELQRRGCELRVNHIDFNKLIPTRKTLLTTSILQDFIDLSEYHKQTDGFINEMTEFFKPIMLDK